MGTVHGRQIIPLSLDVQLETNAAAILDRIGAPVKKHALIARRDAFLGSIGPKSVSFFFSGGLRELA